MKNRRNIILIVLFLGLTNVVMAGGGVTFETRVSDNNTFVLKLKNPEKDRVQVAITDLNGITLHEETHTDSGFKNRYDLSKLPAGTYNLVVSYQDLIKVQPITKQKHILAINQEKMQTVMPPQIEQTAKYLDVKMNCPVGLSLYLMIQDDDGNQLYVDTFKSAGMHRKRFNLNRLENGEYHVSVTVGGPGLNHRYSEEFVTMAGR